MRAWHPGAQVPFSNLFCLLPSLGSIHSLLSAPSAPLCCFPAIKVQPQRKAPGRCPSGTISVQKALWHENIRKAAPISWPHLTRSIAALEILQQVPLSRFQPASFSAFSPFPSCWAPLCQFSAPSVWFQMLFRQGSVERPIGCCRVILLLLAKRLPRRLSRRGSTPTPCSHQANGSVHTQALGGHQPVQGPWPRSTGLSPPLGLSELVGTRLPSVTQYTWKALICFSSRGVRRRQVTVASSTNWTKK